VVVVVIYEGPKRLYPITREEWLYRFLEREAIMLEEGRIVTVKACFYAFLDTQKNFGDCPCAD
jgi:hypothetical protein